MTNVFSGFSVAKPKKPLIFKNKSIMGTGASKTHSAKMENVVDNGERATVIQNASASTLPDNTSIRQQMVESNPEAEEIAEDIEQMVQITQGHKGNAQVRFVM